MKQIFLALFLTLSLSVASFAQGGGSTVMTGTQVQTKLGMMNFAGGISIGGVTLTTPSDIFNLSGTFTQPMAFVNGLMDATTGHRIGMPPFALLQDVQLATLYDTYAVVQNTSNYAFKALQQGSGDIVWFQSLVGTPTSPITKGRIDGNGSLFLSGSASVAALSATGTLSAANGKFTVDSRGQVTSAYGFNVNQVNRPTGFSAAGVSGTGAVTTGTHYYYISYATADGETELSTPSGGTAIGGNPGAMVVTNTTTMGRINVNVTSSTDARVVAIRIYRTSSTSDYTYDAKLVVSTSNVTQTFVDNISDASRAGSDMINHDNSTTQAFDINKAPAMQLGITNTVFGNGAAPNVTGAQNTVFGAGAAPNLGGVNSNVLFGYGVATNGNPSASIGIGQWALFNSAGSNDVSIGHDALFQATANGNRVAIGYASGFANNGSNEVFLGYASGRYETADNTLIIDSLDRSNQAGGRAGALLYGHFDPTVANQFLTVNGTLNAPSLVVSSGTPIVITSGTATAPTNTTTPKAWINVMVSGTAFKMPLYQ